MFLRKISFILVHNDLDLIYRLHVILWKKKLHVQIGEHLVNLDSLSNPGGSCRTSRRSCLGLWCLCADNLLHH